MTEKLILWMLVVLTLLAFMVYLGLVIWRSDRQGGYVHQRNVYKKAAQSDETKDHSNDQKG